MVYQLRRIIPRLSAHAILLAYSALALFPVVVVALNSLKARNAIFKEPYAMPNPIDWSGYETVFDDANFVRYFGNSFFVTGLTIIFVLLLATMASYALAEYKFRFNNFIALYFLAGIMIPLRLGTISLLEIIKDLGLYDNLWALILIYTAMGMPVAIFILTDFIKLLPHELIDAARVDGANEFRILFQIIAPLLRPALGSVAVFNLLVWNDLWFPLIFIQTDKYQTVTLGVSKFIGQYKINYGAMLAALTMAIVPMLIMYIIFSRQLIRGLTAGVSK